MNDNVNKNPKCDDSLSKCSIELLPGRWNQFVVLTSKKLTDSFKFIEKLVSFLFDS